MDYQRFISSFHLRCPACGESDIIDVDVPEFDFSVERMSDLYSEGEIELSCSSCETQFYGHVFCTNHGCSAKIEYDPPFEIDGDVPMFGEDPFDSYDPPSNPYALFVETADRCMILASVDIGAKNDPQFVKRTAFVTLITALEAYLSDTLLTSVRRDKAALINLIDAESDWGKEKIRISEIAQIADFASDFVTKKLISTNFHDLNKAADLYHKSLALNLRFDQSLWKRLLTYVAARHDCVHRNGFDLDGIRREDFDKEFLKAARNDCQTLVERTEGILNPVPF